MLRLGAGTGGTAKPKGAHTLGRAVPPVSCKKEVRDIKDDLAKDLDWVYRFINSAWADLVCGIFLTAVGLFVKTDYTHFNAVMLLGAIVAWLLLLFDILNHPNPWMRHQEDEDEDVT